MVDLGLRKQQEKYFGEHREEILESGFRFAMVHNNKVEYFSDKESLYKSYPHLAPESEPIFGNLPKLVDIGKETNSDEYKVELLEIRGQKILKGLETLVEGCKKLISEIKNL